MIDLSKKVRREQLYWICIYYLVTELSSLLNTYGMIWRVWNVMIVFSPASDKGGNRDKKQKEEKKKDEDLFAADI